jgi:hypothetical protein
MGPMPQGLMWGEQTPCPLVPGDMGAVGTRGSLELEGFRTSLFPELEAGRDVASQLADLPFLP